MDRHSDVVQNENGRAVSGASVLILDSAGAVATIYADRAGAALANPITTDTLGRWSFCAADGVYSARVSLGGKLKATVLDIRLEDPSDGFAALADDGGAALVGTAGAVTVQAALDDLTEQVGGLENYTLPPATDTTLGGIKVGSGLVVDADGVLSNPGVETGTVLSVNSVAPDGAGNVALSTDDIAEDGSPTNLWFTVARVRAVVLTGLDATTNAVIAATDTVLGAFGKLQAQITSLGTSKQDASAKDATGGFAGLTLFKINFKNAANTFTSFFTNANTAARTYTFPDKDGTVAMTSDITSGSMVLLGTATVGSAVANIDFLSTFTSAYDKYVIEVEGVAASVADILLLRLAKAGAADSTASYLAASASGGAGTASAAIGLSEGVTALSATYTLEVRNANDAVRAKSISARGAFLNSSSTHRVQMIEAVWTSATTATGLRLYLSGGANFTAGTVRVYGIKNT